MILLEINKTNKNLYTMKDKYGNTYELTLMFWDIESRPNVGDYIYMNEQLLNDSYEGYSTFYTFGDLNNAYGKTNIKLNDIDVIKLGMGGKEVLLKRLYG